MALAGLLFIDIDGTLVGPRGVSERVWPALAELRAAGWGIGLATGRPGRGEALALARRADPDGLGLHVFESGAAVLSSAGAVVDSEPLPAAALADIVALGARLGATVEAYTASGRYLAEVRDDYILRHEALLGADAELVPAIAEVSGLVRVQWVAPLPAWPALRAAAQRELVGVTVHEGRSPKMPDVVFAAVTAQGVSKGSGITRAAARLGVPLARVAMAGDALNDLSAFAVAGLTFCAADGVPAARAAARWVVPGPDEGGVADAVAILLAG